eukprot:SAG31_NODE_3164_length_4602_cov_7.602043_6_plen_112_part_00
MWVSNAPKFASFYHRKQQTPQNAGLVNKREASKASGANQVLRHTAAIADKETSRRIGWTCVGVDLQNLSFLHRGRQCDLEMPGETSRRRRLLHSLLDVMLNLSPMPRHQLV